jgi:inorganic pyrophosphatase
MKTISLEELDTYHTETGDINVIVETPSGSRNKFKYEPHSDLFLLHKVLPAGSVFPQDFGFIPSTLGADGDPLDVLVLMDEPTFPGNLVRARLIGVIEAEQTEAGKTIRNDRLIAVASACQDYHNVQELDDLDKNLVAQIEHFFVSYNQVEGRKFKPIGRPNAKQAGKLVEEGRKKFRQQHRQEP